MSIWIWILPELMSFHVFFRNLFPEETDIYDARFAKTRHLECQLKKETTLVMSNFGKNGIPIPISM